jgi:hypothetical protein
MQIGFYYARVQTDGKEINRSDDCREHAIFQAT